MAAAAAGWSATICCPARTVRVAVAAVMALTQIVFDAHQDFVFAAIVAVPLRFRIDPARG